MKVTLEFASDDAAYRFIRENRGWIRWDHYDEFDGAGDIELIEVNGKPLPPRPECTRVHRNKSRCNKTHPTPDDPRY